MLGPSGGESKPLAPSYDTEIHSYCAMRVKNPALEGDIPKVGLEADQLGEKIGNHKVDDNSENLWLHAKREAW